MALFPPLDSARTVHEVVTEEHDILETVNNELGTYTTADWVCLFEVRISWRVQQLRRRSPLATCSLLSLVSRVPSGVLASGSLCIANDYVRDRPFSLDSTPCRIGRSERFLSYVIWVCLLQAGAH